MNIVIVGARERRETEADKKQVEGIIGDLRKQHGTRLHVVSAGCDKGVGKIVREYCMSQKVIFGEVRMKLEGENIPRAFFAHMFLARNVSLLEVGDEHYVFKGPNENGIIEAIIEPAQKRVGDSRVKVYELEN
jgi:hypothetical protein